MNALPHARGLFHDLPRAAAAFCFKETPIQLLTAEDQRYFNPAPLPCSCFYLYCNILKAETLFLSKLITVIVSRAASVRCCDCSQRHWAESKQVAATEDTAHPVQTASTRPVHPRSGTGTLLVVPENKQPSWSSGAIPAAHRPHAGPPEWLHLHPLQSMNQWSSSFPCSPTPAAISQSYFWSFVQW